MLTGKQVSVRFARDRIIPRYVDVDDPDLIAISEELLQIFRSRQGQSRGKLEEDVAETIGDDPDQLLYQGLAKLLEDRSEFEVVSTFPPEELRERVFAAAAAGRRDAVDPAPVAGFDRDKVLTEVATSINLTPQAVEESLFADLKSEQRLLRFKDITAKRLLERYNVALAQGVILRSTRVNVTVRNETPQRLRQLFRLIKFHRLVCEVEKAKDHYQFHLDGPLSLFRSTQKYGLQLALFLPAVLRCSNFEVRAELSWGTQRKPKIFVLTPADGLVSHTADHGMFVPPELAMFAELFRKKIAEWKLSEETAIYPLGNSFWVPDFRLVERATGRTVFLEVLGFWRKSSIEKHLERLRAHAPVPFILAVSEQLKIDDADLEGLAAGIHRFRQMPLPDEIVRLAAEIARPV
jgi:predicted nuclease of restriction endonuclease-like RecB superfamily